MNGNVIRTITIRGQAEGIDKLTSDLQKLAAAEKNVAVVSDDMSKKQLSLAAQMRQQTLRLDEAARAQNKIAYETRLADRGLRENLITQQQHAQIVTLANQRYGGLATATMHARTGIAATAKTTALASHEMLNFGRQVADVGTSLAGGASPFMIMAQQGPQFLDILATSGATVGSVFRQVGGVVLRFATSAAGVATGLAAIGVAGTVSALKWNEAKVDVERSLMGIGQRSGATAGQLETIADQAAATTKITITGARETLSALAQTGKIGVEQMTALVNITHDFAKVLGEDIPDAAKIMAQAFADPAKGVEALATRFSILPKQIEQVQRLAQQGNFAGAQNALRDVITPQLEQAAKASSTIANIWEGTKKTLDTAWVEFNKVVDRLAGNNPLADQLKMAKELVQTMQAQGPPTARPPGADKVPGLDKWKENLAAAQKNAETLETTMKKLGAAPALTDLAKDALKLADALIPDVSNLNKMQDALELMDKTLSSPKDLEGVSKDQIDTLSQARQLTKDQLEYVRRIRAEYPGVRTQVAAMLAEQKDQAAVAKALMALRARKDGNVVDFKEQRDKRNERRDISAAA